MFSENEKVVYPGHGVARISRVVEKKIAGRSSHFFELRFLNKEMIVLVPVNSVESIGVRHLSTREGVTSVLDLLKRPARDTSNELPIVNWNKRNKEYQGKIRSGDLCEIGEIYRNLRHSSYRKELSFGEKKLLLQTESLLAEEISIVNDVLFDRATKQLRELVK